MLEKILPYEKSLFFLINSSHSYFMDCAMWLFSGSVVWVLPSVFLIVAIIYKKNWRVWLPILIAITLLFVCADQFSSTICKPYFSRLRPTHYPGIEASVRILAGYSGGKYGFISGHATNSFGFATLTALLFRNKYYSIVIFLWALTFSYSRIYLGVHFVSDIAAGAVVGTIIGLLIYNLYRFCLGKANWNLSAEQATYSMPRTKLIATVLACYMLTVVLSGELLIHLIGTNLFP